MPMCKYNLKYLSRFRNTELKKWPEKRLSLQTQERTT